MEDNRVALEEHDRECGAEVAAPAAMEHIAASPDGRQQGRQGYLSQRRGISAGPLFTNMIIMSLTLTLFTISDISWSRGELEGDNLEVQG